MFCQHLIPSVPLAMCLRPDNGGRRMAADCWNAPQWNQLLHVDCVHHGTFERARLIQFDTAGTPLKRSYPFDCLYFWALPFSPLLLLLRPHCKSGCSTFRTLVALISSVWLKRHHRSTEVKYMFEFCVRGDAKANSTTAGSQTPKTVTKTCQTQLKRLNFAISKAKWHIEVTEVFLHTVFSHSRPTEGEPLANASQAPGPPCVPRPTNHGVPVPRQINLNESSFDLSI